MMIRIPQPINLQCHTQTQNRGRNFFTIPGQCVMKSAIYYAVSLFFLLSRFLFGLWEKCLPHEWNSLNVPFGLLATHKLKEGKANMYTRRIALTRLAKDTLMQMNGAKRKRWSEGGTAHERERESEWQIMQIIFGTHYTIATKQHFNLLIFHYALLAPPARPLWDREERKCVITFHERLGKTFFLWTADVACIIRCGLKHNRNKKLHRAQTRWKFVGNFQFPAHKDLICKFCGWKKQVSGRAFRFLMFLWSEKIFSLLQWIFCIGIFLLSTPFSIKTPRPSDCNWPSQEFLTKTSLISLQFRAEF